jgi:hypothetical protein
MGFMADGIDMGRSLSVMIQALTTRGPLTQPDLEFIHGENGDRPLTLDSEEITITRHQGVSARDDGQGLKHDVVWISHGREPHRHIIDPDNLHIGEDLPQQSALFLSAELEPGISQNPKQFSGGVRAREGYESPGLPRISNPRHRAPGKNQG